MCLAQGHYNYGTLGGGSNPGPLDSESDAQPPGYRCYLSDAISIANTYSGAMSSLL